MESNQQTTGVLSLCRDRKPNFSESELALFFEGICEHIHVLKQPNTGVSSNTQKEAAYKSIANKVNQVTRLEYGEVVERSWREIRKKWRDLKYAAVKKHNARLESESLELNAASEENPCYQLVLDILSGKAKVGITNFRLGSLNDVSTEADRDSTLTHPDRAGTVSASTTETSKFKEKCAWSETSVKTEVKKEDDCLDIGLTLAKWACTSANANFHLKNASDELDDNSMELSDHPGFSKRQRKENFTDVEVNALLREINKHRCFLLLARNQKVQVEKQRKKTWHQVWLNMQQQCGVSHKRTVKEIKKKWADMKLAAVREKRAFENSKQTGPFVSTSPFTRQVFAILDGTFDDRPSAEVEEVDFEAMLKLHTSPSHDTVPLHRVSAGSQPSSPHDSSDTNIEKNTHGSKASFSDSEIKCVLKEVQKHHKLKNTTQKTLDGICLKQHHWQMIAEKVNSISEAGVARSWKDIQNKFKQLKLSALATKAQAATDVQTPTQRNNSTSEYDQLVLKILNVTSTGTADEDCEVNECNRQTTCKKAKGSSSSAICRDDNNMETENLDVNGEELKHVYPSTRHCERHLSALHSSGLNRAQHAEDSLADTTCLDDPTSRRGPNFTEAEVTFMLDYYEANKHNSWKTHFWQTMANKLSTKFAGPHNPRRTTKQVRQQMQVLRSAAVRFWRGEDRPLWMTQAVLERIVKVLDSDMEDGCDYIEDSMMGGCYDDSMNHEAELSRGWQTEGRRDKADDGNADRQRGPNFTAPEVMVILDFYEANRNVLDSKLNDVGTQANKQDLWQALAQRINKMAGPQTAQRTSKQVRKKVKDVRTMAVKCWRGERVKGRPPWMNQSVLERIVSMMDIAGSDCGKEATTSDSSHDNHIKLEQESSRRWQQPNSREKPAVSEKLCAGLVSEVAKFKDVLFNSSLGAGHSEVESEHIAWTLIAEKVNLCSTPGVRWTERELQQVWAELVQEVKEYTTVLSQGEAAPTKPTHYSKISEILQSCERQLDPVDTQEGSDLHHSEKITVHKTSRSSPSQNNDLGLDEGDSDLDFHNNDTINDKREGLNHTLSQNRQSKRLSSVLTSAEVDRTDQSVLFTSKEGDIHCPDRRGGNFTEAEVMVMIDFYSVHRHILTSKTNDPRTNWKKHRAWQSMANKLNKMTGVQTSRHTTKQVREGMQLIRNGATRYWRGQLFKGRPPWMTQAVLERMGEVMESEIGDIIKCDDHGGGCEYREGSIFGGSHDDSINQEAGCSRGWRVARSKGSDGGADQLIEGHTRDIADDGNADRQRGPNFTAPEVMVILDFYEANRQVLNSKKNDSVTKCKRLQLWHSLAQRLNKMTGPKSLLRTSKQVRKKVNDVRTVAVKCWRGEQVRVRPAWMNQSVLKRIIAIMGVDGNAADEDAFAMETREDSPETSGDRDVSTTATIQAHLNALIHNCNALRNLGVDAGSVVFEHDTVMVCGSRRLMHPTSHPHLLTMMSGQETLLQSSQPDDKMVGQWQLITSGSIGQANTSKLSVKTQPNCILSNHGDIPSTHGDIPSTHGDIPSTHGDIPSTHGDISSTHGDISQHTADSQAHLVVLAASLAPTSPHSPSSQHKSPQAACVKVHAGEKRGEDTSGLSGGECLAVEEGAAVHGKLTEDEPRTEAILQAPDTALDSDEEELPPVTFSQQQSSSARLPFTCDFCPEAFPQLSYLVIHRQSHATATQVKDTAGDAIVVEADDDDEDSIDMDMDLSIEDSNNRDGVSDDGDSRDVSIDHVNNDNVPGTQRIHKKASEDTVQQPDSQQRRYACQYCGQKFYTASHRWQHIRIHTGEKSFKCGMCGLAFTQMAGLVNHRKRHKGEGRHRCAPCNISFNTSRGLLAHSKMWHAHLMPKLQTQEDRYKCQDCGKVLSSASRLEIHRRKHTGEKPFTCDICQKGFAEKIILLRHMNTHLTTKAFQCEVCGADFKWKTSLTVHMRYHTGEKAFNCDFCAKAFYSSSKLRVHRRKHTGERPFLCDVCGASFNQGYKLVNHRRSHTGEKPYKCEDCGEAYRDKTSLNIHRRKHTGVQPYTCEVCGKHLSKASHLSAHLRLHTGEKPYTCDVCGDKFSRSDVLFTHKKKHAAKPSASQPSQPARTVLDPALVAMATQPILGLMESHGRHHLP